MRGSLDRRAIDDGGDDGDDGGDGDVAVDIDAALNCWLSVAQSGFAVRKRAASRALLRSDCHIFGWKGLSLLADRG